MQPERSTGSREYGGFDSGHPSKPGFAKSIIEIITDMHELRDARGEQHKRFTASPLFGAVLQLVYRCVYLQYNDQLVTDRSTNSWILHESVVRGARSLINGQRDMTKRSIRDPTSKCSRWFRID